METTQHLAPLRTVTIPINELLSYPSSERAVYFGDLLRLEARGYFACRDTPKLAWAAVNLARYDSIAQFIANCRKIHKGNAVREAIKASRRAYYTKFFDFKSYIPDLVSINRSTPTRQGRPMTPYSQRSVEEHGGYPETIREETIPHWVPFWVRYFGVFVEKPGHRQGEAISNEKLLAYIQLRRYGNFAMDSLIMGHADHLHEGIMQKMHLDLVETILTARFLPDEVDPSRQCLKGLEYLGYADFFGIRPGLQLWKRRMLFEPFFLQLNYQLDCTAQQLRGLADEAITHTAWQLQCARMLADLAFRGSAQGNRDEAARAEAVLAFIFDRLVARLEQLATQPPADHETAERLAREQRAVEVLKTEYIGVAATRQPLEN